MAKRTAPTSESVLDLSIATLHFGLTQLQRELELIAKNKAPDNGHDRGSRIAFLTMRVGSIADSLRKVEAARAKRVTELTMPQVIAWLRQLPTEERARVGRELHAMERRGGVLG